MHPTKCLRMSIKAAGAPGSSGDVDIGFFSFLCGEGQKGAMDGADDILGLE